MVNKFQLIVLYVFFTIPSLGFSTDLSILNDSTPLQSYQSTNTSPSSNKVNPPEAPIRPVNNGVNSDVAKELEEQMNTLNQATLLYQQETNQKIESLRTQTQEIQGKLKNLTEAMGMLNQQLSMINANINNPQNSALPKAKTDSKTHSIITSNLLNDIAFGLLILLAVFIGVLLTRQKKEKAQ